MQNTGIEPPAQHGEYEAILRELTALRADMVAEHSQWHRRLDQVHPHNRASAQNLLHYLALRRHDLRPLQHRLAALGLSSLGRCEAHVLATVDAVLEVVHKLSGQSPPSPVPHAPVVAFAQGHRLLAEHTSALLGPAPEGRGVRIMVTMPGEAADDYTLVHNLLKQGMDCLRINCAHDKSAVWTRIIEHLKRAEQSLGRTCRIVMDIAGPKLRTGPLEPGPAVLRIRPARDVFGRVIAPARVWLTSEKHPHAPPSPADACLPVSGHWLAHLQPGELIQFTDARDAQRDFNIIDVTEKGCWAELIRTAYLTPGTMLQRLAGKGKEKDRMTAIGALCAKEKAITLQPGDMLIITRDQQPGRPATHDTSSRVLTPATIGCTLPEVFDDVRPGETIWFDDGKIGGVVEKIEPASVQVRITQTRLGGAKLRGDKGINLPESQLRLPALTPKDVEDLAFVASHADIVELSFANCARDVELLQQHLAALGSRQPAIVLKIETRRGFTNLPDMLLTAMRSPSCGVMIARGDLAVESGFERLAEVQEEILWICEAAHVPVIWATQVLETLAKEGMPSRAEITDAAMGHRAECVMLNKGPHVLSAVRALDDILKRMKAHQTKKQSMLRELHLAHIPVADSEPLSDKLA